MLGVLPAHSTLPDLFEENVQGSEQEPGKGVGGLTTTCCTFTPPPQGVCSGSICAHFKWCMAWSGPDACSQASFYLERYIVTVQTRLLQIFITTMHGSRIDGIWLLGATLT